jgi:hypothetical protein
MSKPKILIQLDGDQHASVFDAVVAVDSGVDQLFQYAAVEPAAVRDLVHGAIFTRGPKQLQNTAVFVGGSDVAAGEAILKEVTGSFFGPLRVSVLFDANGANTTAAAAVIVASQHVQLAGATATVLAATGPVGQRAVRMLSRAGARVHVASRRLERAEAVCEVVQQAVAGAELTPHATATTDQMKAAIDGSEILIAAGAAGIELVSVDLWQHLHGLQVAIDLNAVPPTGLAVVEPGDARADRHGVVCYGAIGVGGLKMQIHKAAIQKLFDANDQILDSEEIYQIGSDLGHS